MRRRDGLPLWISDGAASVVALHRADLAANSATDHYDEEWLQKMLHDHPKVFPIEQIEPGFGDLIPLCRELELAFGGNRYGSLDNLFATRAGGLAIVEAKLWRNPEARRSVVAQAMEYAAAIFRMSYSDLEATVLKAHNSESSPAASLFEIVARRSQGVEEAEFVDAVSRNLRQGRAIIAIVGDGIREEIVSLTGLLQSHAGHRFTFALVELAVYEAPSPGARLIIPSVLAQTALIERGVVRIEAIGNSAMKVEVVEFTSPSATNQPGRRISIGEDEFFELLSKRNPTLPGILSTFLTKVETLGVYVERLGGLNLRYSAPDGRPMNLASITKDGYVDTSPSTSWGRKATGKIYNDTLANLIGGFVYTSRNGDGFALRTAEGKTPRISDLLPEHEGAWLEAIRQYINSNLAGMASGSGLRRRPKSTESREVTRPGISVREIPARASTF